MAQSNNNDIGELNNNTRQIKGHSVYTVTHGEVAFNWQHQQGCHITPEYQSIFVAIPLLCVSQARYLWKDYHDNQQTFITQMLASQGFVLHQSLECFLCLKFEMYNKAFVWILPDAGTIKLQLRWQANELSFNVSKWNYADVKFIN